MRFKLVALAALIGLAAALSAPSSAEAGWKWKKMKWVPKHGQEYRSPYAHPAPGYRYGHGYRDPYGYRGGYGSHRYGAPRPYGYGSRYNDGW